MHSGPSGYSDPSTPFKNEPQQPPTLTPRFPTNLTGASSAKRITFFKSGDSQFGGVRMAIHNRSFKCFDALLDDLSQKVPLPFGVRTITTPRGTHNIKRLEQLEDGGCYLCSDRRHAKPINMEVAGKRPAVWHHHSRPHSGRRRPTRPEEAPPEHISPHYYRHPKRVVLVKNTDPSVRRSIVLSRRTARSLRVFMEEVSELMQCHIKKLYTIEGRKIDSIQSLMHCPNVLVCVGREPFRPLMLECRKNSEEKLPGMSTRSRSSLCSEGHESKKNVNFGLETKKSIIHPRSDSSNRSTRFSLSSEKSYPNGLCTPGQAGYVSSCPHAKETIINDDIEKRVLVNKDGSLSVEMKVRFRLTNDETLQWSTEIKKSPGATNDAINEKEANPHYLQQGKEFSEQESSGEVEETYTAKLHQRQIDESHCENCCNHCQEYDIWKNPIHREHHRSSRHIKSSSSSASSHKIVRKEASVDSIRTISRSSEEYTEHVVEKASCYQQTVEGGDTMVEYCTISRCCSRSEATTSKNKRSHAERCEGESRMLQNGERRPDTSERRHRHSGVCCVEVTKASDTEDRPVSAISNSSKVLESLQEDEDDAYDDLPASASRTSLCSQGEQENKESSRKKTVSKTPDQRLLSPKGSEVSACSSRSSKHKVKNASPTPADQQQNSPIPNGRLESTASRNSSKCHSCHCGAASPQSAASNAKENVEDGDRPQSTVSKSSKASRESHKSHKDRSHSLGSAASNTQSSKDKVMEEKEEEEEDERTLSAMSGVSRGSGKSGVCPHCGGCDLESDSASRQSEEPTDQVEDNQPHGEVEEKPPSVTSTRSARSATSGKSGKSSKSTKCENHESPRDATPTLDKDVGETNGTEEAVAGDRVESAQSNHSKVSAGSRKSNRSVCSNCRRSSVTESVVGEEKSGSASSGKEPEEEDRVGSSLSNKSKVSHKSNCSTSNRAKSTGSPAPITEDEEARDGAVSAQPNTSHGSKMSKKSVGDEMKRADSKASVASEKQETEDALADRSASVMSTSKQASMEEKLGTDDPGEIIDERATSAQSSKTDASVKSHRSHRANCSASKRAKSPAARSSDETGVTNGEEETAKRAESALSGRSNISAASGRSARPESKASERAASQISAVSEICQEEPEADEEERAASVLSNKSKASNRSNITPKPSCSDEEPSPAEEDPAKPAEQSEVDSRAPSVMSNASARSRASQKSACSTSSRAKSPRAAPPAKIDDLNTKAPESAEEENTCDPETEAPVEERPTSVMSNKTDTSVKSKASQKLVLAAPERSKSPRPKSPAKVQHAEKEDEAEKRPASSLSVKSDVSRTSRRSKRAASPAKPCEDERSSSAMSRKSTKSSPKTNKEAATEERAPSETVVNGEISDHETTEPSANSNALEGAEEKEERAASAMSNKSDASVKSKASQKSALQAADKAPTSRAKSPASSDRAKEDESEKRPVSSLSVRTDVSRSSRKSQAKEAKRSPSPTTIVPGGNTEVTSEVRSTSAMSKKSIKSSKNQAKEENEVQERVPSAMSSKTTASIKSNRSQKASHNPEEHSDDTAKVNEAEQRPESVMSQTSDKTSLKGAPELASTSAEPTDTPAGQEVKQAAEEVNERSKSALSVASHSSKKSARAPSPRPKSSQSKTGKAEEEPRASSALSGNSKVSSKSRKCQCNHSTLSKTPDSPESKTTAECAEPENADKPLVPDVISTTEPEDPEGPISALTPNTKVPSEDKRAESVKSVSSSTKSKAIGLKKEPEDRSPSALPTSSGKVTRSKSPAPAKAEEPSANSETENACTGKVEDDSGNEKTAKDSRPKSSASARSARSTKSHKVTKTNDVSEQLSYLDVKVPINDLDGKSENGSVKSFKSTKKAKSVKFDKTPEKDLPEEKNSRPNSGAMSDGSQNCSSPAQEQPNLNKPPTIRLASTSSDSVLSNALSAADLLRELSGNTRPGSRVSQKKEKENDKPETKSNKSSKDIHKKISSSQRDEQSSLELVQSCLPNTSPNDVVNEWLMNIPVDGSMYQMEDELAEPDDLPQVESVVNSGETVQNESEQETEEAVKAKENADEGNVEKENDPEAIKELEEDAPAEGDITDASLTEEPNTSKSNFNSPKRAHFPKRSHSSVQVMKALLSPKMDRCNSLPEVSPVYGRKLSKSAKGLLDCLTKLRLIDSDPTGTQNSKYSEIMNILQTLWLYEPTEGGQGDKDHPRAEDEANPRSSSGVDVSSGSDESAKSMTNGGEEKAASAPPTLIVEQLSDAVSAEDADEETPAEAAPQEGDDEDNCPGPAAEKTAETEQEDVSDSATPDVAVRIKGSPEESPEEKSDEAVADAEIVTDGDAVEEPKSAETPEENAETVQSPTDSSGKESKSANGTESDRPGDSSSSTPPSVQRAQLTRKVSQDPDPMWVLSLLKKIEKQFMTHYANAMAEFKVRWDLDDNVMLDTMINELKVEVHKRIQESIKRELQKIQGRAGRSPRPPMTALSKESSVQTDQRRRRLKVMRKQSLMPSKSEDSDVASGTDNSDQRSEDEYCPCDTCMRKKMEARQMLRAEVMNIAPVMMDFDLRKILQIKRDPPPAPKVEQPPAEPHKTQHETEAPVNQEEGANLEVVQEEPEQEEVPEEVNAEEEEPNEEGEKVDAEEEEEKDGGEEGDAAEGEDGVAIDGTVTEEAEEEGEEAEEAEKTNEKLEIEEGEDEQTAEAEIAEEETAETMAEDGGDNEVAGDDETAADGSAEQDAADQQLSKDGTEDEAIAEKTPMDDTDGDVDGNQGDSTEAVDEIDEYGLDEEIQKVCNEDGTEEAVDTEGDTTIKSDTAEEVSEGLQDQGEDGEDESEEDTKVVSLKAAKGDSWEQFRNRQMTRTSVESQPGSLDSVELEQEAKQIVQSVFSSITAHKIDRDETDEGLKMTSKKRSRSPARANKPRRPKDSDIKVDDLEF